MGADVKNLRRAGRRLTGRIGAAVVCLLVIAGCQTPNGTGDQSGAASENSPAPVARLRAETVLPARFGSNFEEPRVGTKIFVPPSLLRISTVKRPRADVRNGPGTQFDLEDFVLPNGAKVLVFDRVGVWQKIVAIDLKKRGWVHYQSLGEISPTKEALTVEMRLLPTALAMHAIAAAATFPAKTGLKVMIPKGAMFRTLAFDESDALVVVPTTNSVMWVSRKDMR